MTDKQLKSLGEAIAKARGKQGLSFRKVASALGVDAAWVLKLERGEMREPSPEKLAAICDVLGLSSGRIDRLTGGYVSSELLNSRAYFRARYDLSAEQTEFIESEIAKLKKRK